MRCVTMPTSHGACDGASLGGRRLLLTELGMIVLFCSFIRAEMGKCACDGMFHA